MASGHTFDLVISGGTVLNPDAAMGADIGIRGETIAVLAEPGMLRDASRVIEADDLFVVPGGVDPHAHTAFQSGDIVSLDDFFGSTSAAAYGGTTTMVDFAFPDRQAGETTLQAVKRRQEELSGRAVVDVALHACITQANAVNLAHIPELVAAGLPTFKLFTIYRGEYMLDLDEVYRCLTALGRSGGLALIHAESPHMVEPMIEEFGAGAYLDPTYHARSRPPESELDMVRTLIELLRLTGAGAWIVHVSTPEAALEIAQARANGVRIWAETCPQYVFLDESRYAAAGGELFVCSPPLRSEERRARLAELLARGIFTVWGSDHCAYGRAQKERYRDDFRRIPGGLPGVETRCPLLFSDVMRGRLSAEEFVRLTSTNPARLTGLFPRKGIIAPGSDADVVLYDPAIKGVISASGLHMASDYTPFEGIETQGWPVMTISRGTVVIEDGQIVVDPGHGRFVPGGIPTPPNDPTVTTQGAARRESVAGLLR